MRSFLFPLLDRPDIRHALRCERDGCVLADAIEVALDSRSRRRGLLGRDGLATGSALIIAPCQSIHMFFMRFAIDVVFVRRDGTVARACEWVRPWRIRAALSAYAAIELPAGTLAACGTRRGDRLVLMPETPAGTEAPASSGRRDTPDRRGSGLAGPEGQGR